MKLYTIKGDDNALVFDSKELAIRHAVRIGKSTRHIKNTRSRSFNSIQLGSLLENTLHYWNNQSGLQQALLSALEQKSKDLRFSMIAQRLNQGDSIGDAMWAFLPSHLKPMLATLKQSSGEEPKIAVIKAVVNMLNREQELSQHLTKNLNYPFLIIQSALVMACINALFNNRDLFFTLCLWLCVSAIQLVIFYLVKSGYIARWLTQNIKGFRYENTLSIIVEMTKTGVPLHRILKGMCLHSHQHDILALYQSVLLLDSGSKVSEALPQQWFPKAKHYKLCSIDDTSDLLSPLIQAREDWATSNQYHINLLCKIIPLLGIVIAALFVTYTLLELYLPIMELNQLV